MKVKLVNRRGLFPENGDDYVSHYLKQPNIRMSSAELTAPEAEGEELCLKVNREFSACRERLTAKHAANFIVIKLFKSKAAILKAFCILEDYLADTSHEGCFVPQLLHVENKPKGSRTNYIAINIDLWLTHNDRVFYVGLLTSILSRHNTTLARCESAHDFFQREMALRGKGSRKEIMGRFGHEILTRVHGSQQKYGRSHIFESKNRSTMYRVIETHPEKYTKAFREELGNVGLDFLQANGRTSAHERY